MTPALCKRFLPFVLSSLRPKVRIVAMDGVDFKWHEMKLEDDELIATGPCSDEELIKFMRHLGREIKADFDKEQTAAAHATTPRSRKRVPHVMSIIPEPESEPG
jgi:hypothetical protein